MKNNINLVLLLGHITLFRKMIDTRSPSGFEEKLPEGYLIEENFKQIIKKNYSLSGFTPIDTSNVERVEVLSSKGADDNEIYGIKRLKAEDKNDFEMGLRFDLTVPLARYVSKYEGEITFPFKRQHIGRVYRGERPQKGRYREFYQADVDIIGNDKLELFADVEIVSTIYNSLKQLNFGDFVININNKKLLSGFLESLGVDEIQKTISIIDKKDKITKNDFELMLKKSNIDEKQIVDINKMIDLSKDSNINSLDTLSFFEKYENGLLKEGLSELKYIYKNLIDIGVVQEFIKINPSISRGLNYYTGLVFETFINNVENMGSIASGGRYDDLCNHFSKNNFPGVGGSIGLSRLIAILDEINKIKVDKKTVSDTLVLNTGENILSNNLRIVKKLRNIGINTELYLDSNAKFSKQIKYADNKKIKYVLIQGENEIKNKTIQIKNLYNGNQSEININDLEDYFK